MTDFYIDTDSLPTRSDYVIDGRIAWWKVQARRQAIVLTASGEIDASNTDHFSNKLHRLASVGDPLIVDLTAVDFFGVQGLRVLIAHNDDCRRVGLLWALVAGRAVCPLLRIGDLGAALPVVRSVTDALQQFGSDKCGRRQLIPLFGHPRRDL
jgi:anti-anti-sigma factor